MKIFTALAFLMLGLSVRAETGWVYHGDLNGDGVADKIESGPMWTFGNGGGAFVVTISGNADLEQKTYSIGGKPECFAIEHTPKNKMRLWTFWHLSSQEGGLISYVFNENGMKKAVLTINPGDGGTVIGNAIMDAVFNDETRINFEKVENYIVPPNPSGEEWGK